RRPQRAPPVPRLPDAGYAGHCPFLAVAVLPDEVTLAFEKQVKLPVMTLLVTVTGPGVFETTRAFPPIPHVPPGAAHAPPFPLRVTWPWLSCKVTLFPKLLPPHPPPVDDVP